MSSKRKKCKICGHSIPKKSDICNKCKNKIRAANDLEIIIPILKNNLQQEFKKNDLKKIKKLTDIDNIMDNLIDNNLLDEYSQKYKLKEKEDIDNFLTEININKSVDWIIANVKPIGIINKQCKHCEKILTLSKFKKTNKTKDGYADYCKKCAKIFIAKKNLDEILKIMKPNETFTKIHVKNEDEIIESLIDNNLILNITNDEYQIASEKEINNFLIKNKFNPFTEINPKMKIFLDTYRKTENKIFSQIKANITNEEIINSCKTGVYGYDDILKKLIEKEKINYN